MDELNRARRERDRNRVAEAVRQACIATALDGYERAGISGLCQEGRWEAAIEAVRSLDLRAVLSGLE